VSGQPKRQDDGKGGPRGYDAGKHVTGRKRHIIVDTEGLLLRVVVHAANVQDRDGGKMVVADVATSGAFPRLEHLWADGADGGTVEFARDYAGLRLEVVKRAPDTKGFVVQPRRWVVERTFGWFGRNRALSKDYEALPESSEAWIYLAMIHLMLKRLQPK
jgi:putative transposase